MENISTAAGLRDAIVYLEAEQAREGAELNEQFRIVYDSLKPINLIKGAFEEITGSKDIQENLLTSSVGLATGYLSKLLVQGIMKRPLNKFFGTAVMFGTKNIVSQNPEAIKFLGKIFFNLFRGKADSAKNKPDE
ncbi:MAG: hypothetical protein K0B15_08775 [Lentimicrobium sp.]|nr:hypothetical protein [Lentimicrobium sp.]